MGEKAAVLSLWGHPCVHLGDVLQPLAEPKPQSCGPWGNPEPWHLWGQCFSESSLKISQLMPNHSESKPPNTSSSTCQHARMIEIFDQKKKRKRKKQE